MHIKVLIVCLLGLGLHTLNAARLSPYITWGSNAERGDWNSIGSLEYLGEPVCGCSLISEDWVVTAAHCVWGRQPWPERFEAWLGVTDKFLGLQGEKYEVVELFMHPDFINENFYGYPNDIAVMRLAKPADLNDPYIEAMPMDMRPYDFPHQDCMIAGWGQTCSTCTILPAPLQEAPMNVLQKDQCNVIYGERLVDLHLCVINEDTNATPCIGDGGTPLKCVDNDVTVLCGVYSWGSSTETCNGFLPAVYTRISYHCDWIQSMTGVECTDVSTARK